MMMDLTGLCILLQLGSDVALQPQHPAYLVG